MGVEAVKMTARDLELLRGAPRRELLLAVSSQDMANQRRGQPFVELRLFFMDPNLAQLGDAVPQTPWDFSL
jgi:hypothetical protein